MKWQTTTALLCIYGAVKEFRPATPFLTPFLASAEKNMTLDQVYSQVYPYWTYSYLVALMPMFILTDLLRYKPMIVCESIGLVLTWALLVFGKGVRQMQLMQVAFGISSAAEIGYYSYIYSIVASENYKTVTSYIRTSALLGKLSAFALGQVLITTKSVDYLVLNQISLAAVSLVTILAIFLPYPRLDGEESEKENLMSKRAQKLFSSTLGELKSSLSNRHLVIWCIWWSLASCGMYQVQNYSQSLWNEMQVDSSDVSNGLVEFINTCLGAILSFSIQYLAINWANKGQLILPISSMLVSILLYISSRTNHVIIAYTSYILMSSTYYMLITAASANVAKDLKSNNHGLIFGCNTFIAVALQTILTLIVVDSRFLHFDIRSQFVVYSGYFAVISIIFLIALIAHFLTKRKGDATVV